MRQGTSFITLTTGLLSISKTNEEFESNNVWKIVFKIIKTAKMMEINKNEENENLSQEESPKRE